MGNILEIMFLIKDLEIRKIIPFPVSKTGFGLLGKIMKSFAKQIFGARYENR